MHKFASWTYCWSLWWLDITDYNAITSFADVGPGVTYPLSSDSYVVAEDSGLYPDRRLPTQLGLNYNIQNVELTTVVGHNSSSKSSNLLTGSMTILEPYGVTFMDGLIEAAYIKRNGQNYLHQPYMLQLDFKGFDDAGNPIPEAEIAKYRKRFPINLLGIKVNVSAKGAEYKIDFTPIGHQGFKERATTPKDINVTAATVGEFFTKFSEDLNNFWKIEVGTSREQYGDTIKFDLDPAIKQSSIIYSNQMSLLQANPVGAGIDLSRGNFSIPKGTQIVEVINKILYQSTYLQAQLGLNQESLANAAGAAKDDIFRQYVQTSLTQIFNTFKTTSQVIYAGADKSGTLTNEAFDNKRNRYPIAITYCVQQYPEVTGVNHPAGPLFTDSRPYISKTYNYLYTGKNVDILDLKIKFDTTWYTAVSTYTREYASTTPTVDTNVDSKISLFGVTLLSPQLLGATGYGFAGVRNLTPLQYKSVLLDSRDTTGMNILNNPGSQTVASVMRSIYSRPQGDMVTVDLQIVGDPTLIKQDDWLYVPSPSTGTKYHSWDSQGQSAFAKENGHVRFDAGPVVVSLTVNTPLDIDTDWGDQGLAFPQPNTLPSLFSGLYKILIIKNTFNGGKFEQTLKLVRHSQSDYITNSTPAVSSNSRDTVGTSVTNQSSTNTNVSTPGSAGGTTTPTVDNTRIPP